MICALAFYLVVSVNPVVAASPAAGPDTTASDGTTSDAAAAAPAATGPDVAAAQQAYNQARYDDALSDLGGSCAGAADYEGCEKLRAFINIAIGHTGDARAAFDRLLAKDADATLDPNVSPKLQSLFAKAKSDMLEVTTLALEVTEQSAGSDLLEVHAPADVALQSLAVHVERGDAPSFDEVDLTQNGDVWSGTWQADLSGVDSVHYYLAMVVPSGVTVSVGSETAPHDVTVAHATTGVEAPTDALGLTSPLGAEDSSATSSGGLPRWALWSIIGGSAALVAAGVITAVVVTQHSNKPGSIEVNVAFGDDP